MKCEICGLDTMRGTIRCYNCIEKRFCLIAGCQHLEAYGFLCEGHVLDFDKFAGPSGNGAQFKKWVETRDLTPCKFETGCGEIREEHRVLIQRQGLL